MEKADLGSDALPEIGVSMGRMLAALLVLVMVALLAFSVIGREQWVLREPPADMTKGSG